MSSDIVDLDEGQVTSWRAGAGSCTFRVLQGTVWFTCENEPADLLVAQGELLTLAAPGKVVAQSLIGTASIAVLTP
jgi:hypothetical protein